MMSSGRRLWSASTDRDAEGASYTAKLEGRNWASGYSFANCSTMKSMMAPVNQESPRTEARAKSHATAERWTASKSASRSDLGDAIGVGGALMVERVKGCVPPIPLPGLDATGASLAALGASLAALDTVPEVVPALLAAPPPAPASLHTPGLASRPALTPLLASPLAALLRLSGRDDPALSLQPAAAPVSAFGSTTSGDGDSLTEPTAGAGDAATAALAAAAALRARALLDRRCRHDTKVGRSWNRYGMSDRGRRRRTMMGSWGGLGGGAGASSLASVVTPAGAPPLPPAAAVDCAVADR